MTVEIESAVNKLKMKPWFEDTCLQMLLVLGPPPQTIDTDVGSDDFWDSKYRIDYVARYLARGRWLNQAEDYLKLRHKIPFAYISDMIVAFELWLKEREDEQKRDA